MASEDLPAPLSATCHEPMAAHQGNEFVSFLLAEEPVGPCLGHRPQTDKGLIGQNRFASAATERCLDERGERLLVAQGISHALVLRGKGWQRYESRRF